jgi:hypothetical protein
MGGEINEGMNGRIGGVAILKLNLGLLPLSEIKPS